MYNITSNKSPPKKQYHTAATAVATVNKKQYLTAVTAVTAAVTPTRLHETPKARPHGNSQRGSSDHTKMQTTTCDPNKPPHSLLLKPTSLRPAPRHRGEPNIIHNTIHQNNNLQL